MEEEKISKERNWKEFISYRDLSSLFPLPQ